MKQRKAVTQKRKNLLTNIKQDVIHTRVSPATRAALDRMARETRRPRGALVRILLEDATGTATD